MPLAVPVIDSYERIFYNVRPRLSASSWVRLSALGRKFTTETGEPNVRTIAMHFAYYGGVHILAMVLPRLLDGTRTVGRAARPGHEIRANDECASGSPCSPW